MTNLLILCTGNSARSIMGEAIANRLGGDRLRAFSAGSQPKDEPHPQAITVLAEKGYDTSAFRSKSWDAFAGSDTPEIDIVITVCDNAAGETCPIFPGKAIKGHWGIEDPAAVEGEGQREAFLTGYAQLEARLTALMELDFENCEHSVLQDHLSRIGAMPGATQLAAHA